MKALNGRGAGMSESQTAEIVDGRRLRSERSRRAIIDAGLSLIDEGDLAPTAQQISDRAGVGIRSFFRHFEDMEAFFTAVDDQIRGHYESLFSGGDRDGTLNERIEHAAEMHAQAYEQIFNLILSSRTQLWRYKVVQKNYSRGQRQLRKDLDEWLPELGDISKDERETIDAIASFDMWHRLRAQQGLSVVKSTQIVTNLLKGLILPD